MVTGSPRSIIHYINGLVQERRNSSPLAMELRISCTNPSTCKYGLHNKILDGDPHPLDKVTMATSAIFHGSEFT